MNWSLKSRDDVALKLRGLFVLNGNPTPLSGFFLISLFVFQSVENQRLKDKVATPNEYRLKWKS